MTDTMETPNTAPTTKSLLEVRDLTKYFSIRTGIARRVTGRIHAVDGVSFSVGMKETLGIVGESGCGKTTTARVLLGLLQPTSGTAIFSDFDLFAKDKELVAQRHRKLQMVFQDPYASLNPRLTVQEILAEPLLAQHRDASKEVIEAALETVGLSADYLTRYPHQFSGGQRQRIGIARALIVQPELIVLDEPVSALDVSIQAGVLNLLKDVRDERGLSYVLIAHDLSVVRSIADRIAVMYLGKIVEYGTRDQIFSVPKHPYTEALLSAVPIPDPNKERARQRIVLTGDVPSPANPPSGCRFRTRCPKAQAICAEQEPLLTTPDNTQAVACHFPSLG